jgi:branched-chain amino acid transport system substrate-binding protein
MRLKTKQGLPPIVFIVLGFALLLGMPKLVAYLLNNKTAPVLTNSIQERMSWGDKLLILADATPEKKAGISAFANKEYRTAIAKFQAALIQQQNDPETLIYLNNAIVRSASTNTPKIAVSVPIGSNLNVARELLRGVAQAQHEINRSGGKRLQVEIINDENNPDIAKQVAKALIADPQVLAVVGHNASEASLAAAPIYQSGQLVMITPTSSAQKLAGFGSYIFRALPSTRFLAEPLAKYVLKVAKKSRVATCYNSQAPDNITFRDEFTASLIADGGQLINIDCDMASASFNPSTSISQAISSGADAILLTPHIDQLEKSIDIARSNKSRLALFSSPSMYTMQTLQSGGSDVNGLTMPVVWHPQMEKASVFTKQATKLWGGQVNWRTATAYDATRAIIQGLEKASTRSELQATLRNPDFSTKGAGEVVKFLPSGDRYTRPRLVQVRSTTAKYEFVLIDPK